MIDVGLYLCCTGCCLFVGPTLRDLTKGRRRGFVCVSTSREKGTAPHDPAGAYRAATGAKP